MASKIADLKEENGLMSFTLQGTDISYANAIRRTILSDIPIVVFKTTPYEKNKSKFMVNTTRLNNEILKQRLSCIPICIPDFENMDLNNYLLEVDVENNTDTVLIVTTKDFRIRNIKENKYLDESAVRKIFPPFTAPNGKEYYIDFVRLRPKLSDEIPGEKIKFTCEFSVGTAREDSMFNITGTCSYGCTPDEETMLQQLEIRKQKWKDDEGMTEDEIKFQAKNWKLLEGLRYVIKNSFNFVLSSVGIYENEEIMIKACNILSTRLDMLKNTIQEDKLEIKPAISTMENCYDITLENEDYTIGNILNYELYSVFYTELNKLAYVGFKKLHPHDTDSILRVTLTDNTKGVSELKIMLIASIETAIKTLLKIRGGFDGTRQEEK
jgi:DNA-directed RNA polymerase subunit L